jgi:hypothetical protein
MEIISEFAHFWLLHPGQHDPTWRIEHDLNTELVGSK